MSSQSISQARTLNSRIAFLERDAKHQTEKPYKLQYDPGPDSAIPRTNTVSKYHEPIEVQDFRFLEKPMTFENNGFCALNMQSKLSPEDFYDEDKIRRRQSDFPISTGEDYDHLQPTSIAHVDFTLNSALESTNDVLKVNAAGYKRVQCINIWKPLRGPISDWPLGLCDETTADMQEDYIASDVVSRTGFTENYLIYHNPKQKWYYLSDQKASELIIFRQGDTDFPHLKGVPHTGFQNFQSNPEEAPRESVEARGFIYY